MTNWELAARFGALYSARRVKEALGGVDDDTFRTMVEHGEVLAVVTADGMEVFPAFQFGNDQCLRPVSREVVSTLTKAGMEPWSILYLLTTPLGVLDGHTGADVIVNGSAEDHDELVGMARQQAADWSTY